MSDYSDTQIENEIKAKITPESLEAKIVSEDYHVFPETTVTVCMLVLENGFCVVGESAAVSPENFDAEIGRKVARQKSRDKLWALEGYLLKEQIYQASL